MSYPHELYSAFNLSLDHGIAENVGVDAAIVFNHIVYWLRINASKKETEMIDGKYWMYQTQEEMSDFFRFYSPDQVYKALKKLEDSGLIVKDKLSPNPFDRKNWYTVYDQSIIKKCLRNPEIRDMPDTEDSNKVYETLKSAESDPVKIRTSDLPKSAGCTYTNKQKQNIQTQQHVVPPKEGEGFCSSQQKITKDDVYSMANRLRKDWTAEEIENSWTIFQESSYPVTDPFAYIEGTIKKSRTMKQIKDSKRCYQKNQTTIKKESENLKKESNITKEPSLDTDMSEQPLAKFWREFQSRRALRSS